MRLGRAIATVGGFTFASRILGFVRDILMALFMGAGLVSDSFFVAFKLPNFFRRLFAEGAFSAAFVPLFSRRLEEDGSDTARAFAEEAFSLLTVILVGFVALVQIFMPWAMIALAPGFVDQPEKFDLAVTLTRITFPYLLLISLVSLMGGVLNALGRFAAVAGTPILLNLSLIGTVLFLRPYTATTGHALAAGVTLGGVLQFLWLFIECRRAGMPMHLRLPRITPGMRRLARLMAPGIVGAGAVQVNLVIDVILASLLPEGSLSFLFYADRLNQLPLGVIGIAVGTALLPLLSRQLSAGETRAALANHNRAVEVAMLFALPAAVALLVIPEALVGGLFERGAFTAADTDATALALGAYAVGTPAYILIKVFVPGFYAREDTTTPVKFAMIALGVNVVLNIALMIPFAHMGLALATALSAWLNAALLGTTLRRRGHFIADARLRRRLPRIGAAALMMGLGLVLAAAGLAPVFGPDQVGRIALVVGLVATGIVLYFALARLFAVFTFAELRALLTRRDGQTA